jgi:1-phosphatidylinositol-4-phosphate 5-kinase
MKFIEAITKSPEEAAREPLPALPHVHSNAVSSHSHSHSRPETYTESAARRSGSQPIPMTQTAANNVVVQRNEKEALKSEQKRTDQEEPDSRVISTVRSPSADRTGNTQGQTLPVVEELGEASSLGDKSGKSGRSRDRDEQLLHPTDGVDDRRPITPVKDFGPSNPGIKMVARSSLDKELPPLPLVESPMDLRNEDSVFS